MTKPKKHQHIDCLVKKRCIRTHEGVEVDVYELQIDRLDKRARSSWAKHFREHYCLDFRIDSLMRGTPHKTRRDFLLNQVFPTKEGFGPATRSGDFTEILIADFVESVLEYWVPRMRYSLKQIQNESPKGSDIVGMKFKFGDATKASLKDSLVTFEVKGQMHPKAGTQRLQDAVDDARKDDVRGAFRVSQTLNALKHRYIERDDDEGRMAVERFQDPLARPYIHQIGASAVYCTSAFDADEIRSVTTAAYAPGSKLMLVVVRGDDMMKFVHEMYTRAADEA